MTGVSMTMRPNMRVNATARLAGRRLRAPFRSVRNGGGSSVQNGGCRSSAGRPLADPQQGEHRRPPENERFIEALRAECYQMMGGHIRFPRSCGRIFP